jgi:hypothetical protein
MSCHAYLSVRVRRKGRESGEAESCDRIKGDFSLQGPISHYTAFFPPSSPSFLRPSERPVNCQDLLIYSTPEASRKDTFAKTCQLVLDSLIQYHLSKPVASAVHDAGRIFTCSGPRRTATTAVYDFSHLLPVSNAFTVLSFQSSILTHNPSCLSFSPFLLL